MTTFAENNITAHYDKQASEFVRQAAAWATLADAASPPERERYWATSQEYFHKAIDALEVARIAAIGK